MARPAMRNVGSRWSLLQLAAAAGISHRTARTLVTAGYFNAEALDHRDIVPMRVAAALLDAPRPTGEPRQSPSDQTLRRNFAALSVVRTFVSDPTPKTETLLVVRPHDTRTVDNPMSAIGVLGDMGDQPMLVLPIGQWTQAAHQVLRAEAS